MIIYWKEAVTLRKTTSPMGCSCLTHWVYFMGTNRRTGFVCEDRAWFLQVVERWFASLIRRWG